VFPVKSLSKWLHKLRILLLY